jgi:hypothetical protein
MLKQQMESFKGIIFDSSHEMALSDFQVNG